MKSVLITGASTGIGRASALCMDGEGWRVFAGVRRKEDAESLRATGSNRITPLMLDITDAARIAATAEQVTAELAGDGLDGLVNNAGIAVPGPLETVPIEDLRRQLDVNLIAQVAVTQAFLPLIRSATGRIVFLSSIGGRMALPFGGPYHASKYGIEAVADCFRQELRQWKIPVAIVEPGAIDTPIWDRGEALAAEIAERSPVAQEELYGEAIERFRKLVHQTAKRGIAPEKVARAIAHALTADRPRSRYLVGLDARGQVLLKALLPTRALDALIGRITRA